MDWDSVKNRTDCLTPLPCFLLIYWVDFLADCSSPLSRARLWPSVPDHHCVLLLLFPCYSVPCAIFIQTLWRWHWVRLLACRVCLMSVLKDYIVKPNVEWKKPNNTESILQSRRAVLHTFIVVVVMLLHIEWVFLAWHMHQQSWMYLYMFVLVHHCSTGIYRSCPCKKKKISAGA